MGQTIDSLTIKIKNTEIKILCGDPSNFAANIVIKGTDLEIIQNDVREKTAQALRKKGRSIVLKVQEIPAHCPPAGIAKIMIQEILKVLRRSPTTLDEVVFNVLDKNNFKIFGDTIPCYVKHLQDDLGWGPYVTVDIIIEMNNGIVLIERSNPPYGWALPGGFLDYGESLEETAVREAKEETNLELVNLKQFHTYSQPGRDPRFDTVSTVFIAKGQGTAQSGDDAKALKIVPFNELLKLDYAFDHKQIIKDYLNQK